MYFRKEMHNKTQRKTDGNEEFDSPTKDDLLPEKLERPEDPLAEALKFLQPLQQLAANDLSTHIFAFEIYYRKGKFLTHTLPLMQNLVLPSQKCFTRAAVH
jgi:peptide alpha-N-acetyltransferase